MPGNAQKISLTLSVRRGLAALAMIGIPAAASVAIAGLSSEPALPGEAPVVSQAVLIEYANGLYDGIAFGGADLRGFDLAMASLQTARVDPFVGALRPVYESGFARGASGEVGCDQLGAYIAAASGAASVRDEIRFQAEKLAGLAGMDDADAGIFLSIETFKGYVGVIEGDAAGEAAFMMLMTEVAHDDMRTAFVLTHGGASMIKGSQDSFEGFLAASRVSPASPAVSDAREAYLSLVRREAEAVFPGHDADISAHAARKQDAPIL